MLFVKPLLYTLFPDWKARMSASNPTDSTATNKKLNQPKRSAPAKSSNAMAAEVKIAA